MSDFVEAQKTGAQTPDPAPPLLDWTVGNLDRDGVIWQKVAKYAKSQGVTVVEKRQSKLMWLSYIGLFMWIWNPGFMDKVTTVSGKTIYMPVTGIGRNWSTLAHELVHVRSRSTQNAWQKALYSFPQLFAVLGLLGFLGFAWAPLFSLFALLLVFLPPFIPAYWRIEEEIPAMGMSVAVTHYEYRYDGLPIAEGLVPERTESLLGQTYFWPALLLGSKYKRTVYNRIDAEAKRIADHEDQAPYSLVVAGFQEWTKRTQTSKPKGFHDIILG